MKKSTIWLLVLYFLCLSSIVMYDNFHPKNTLSYSGRGAIWAMRKGDFISKNFNGDSLGLEAARAYCVAKGGGVIQMGPGTETIGIRAGLEPNILLLKSFMTGWSSTPTSIIDVAVLDTLNFRSIRGDTIRTDYLTGKLSNSASTIHLGNMILNDSLRVNKTVEVVGGIKGKLVIADSLRVNKTSELIGSTNITNKLVVSDSLRVNKTTELVGNLTAQGKAIVDDSLRVTGLTELVGNATLQGKAVIDDSLRVTGTTELVGNVTLQGKGIVDDSLRVTGPTHLASNLTLGNGGDIYLSDVTGGSDRIIDRESQSVVSIRMPDSGSSVVQIIDSAGSNVLLQVSSDGRIRLGTSMTYATMTGGGAFNGTIIYCSDCNKAAPCTSGGTGAFAFRVNGVWDCIP